MFVPKSSTPTLSAAIPSVQSVGSPTSASDLTSPSRSSLYTGWTNPTEYDEGEDPFDPFSNYQHGNGYENGADGVAPKLQTVSSLSDHLSSCESLDFSSSWVTDVDLAALFQLVLDGYNDPHGQHPLLPPEYPSSGVDYYQPPPAFVRQPVRLVCSSSITVNLH